MTIKKGASTFFKIKYVSLAAGLHAIINVLYPKTTLLLPQKQNILP